MILATFYIKIKKLVIKKYNIVALNYELICINYQVKSHKRIYYLCNKYKQNFNIKFYILKMKHFTLFQVVKIVLIYIYILIDNN